MSRRSTALTAALLLAAISLVLMLPQRRTRTVPRQVAAKSPPPTSTRTPSTRTNWERASDVGAGSGLRGVVTLLDGTRLPGTAVCLWYSSDASGALLPRGCVQTDSLGLFKFDAPPGLWTVSASSPGFLDLLQRWRSEAQRYDDAKLVMQTGGAEMRGRVIDAAGGVVADAVVTAFASGALARPGAEAVSSAVSNTAGEFAMFLAPRDVELRVAAEGYATALVPTRAPQHSLEIALSSGSRLSGLLVDSAYTPISLVTVQARSERAPGGVAQAVTAADGSFALDGVGEGLQSIGVISDDWYATPIRVQVERDAEQGGVRIVAFAARTIRGRVLVDGEPCRRGQVLLSGPTVLGAEVGHDGSVRLGSVPPATYSLKVQCESAIDLHTVLSLDKEGAALARDLVWQLSRGSDVRVRLESRDLGARDEFHVQASRQVQIDSDLNPRAAGVQSAVTCSPLPQGLFDCRGLSAGSYQFSVSNAGRTLVETVRVVVNGHNPDLVMRVPDGGALHVRLSGGIPRNPRVLADGPVRAQAESAPDGTYWFRHLVAGSYLVHSQGHGEPARVNVDAAAIIEVHLSLPPLETLQGTVLDTAGNVVPGATVHLYERSSLVALQPTRQCLTDPDGRFEFAELPSDTYQISVESSAGTGQYRVTTAQPAEIRVPSEPLLPDWLAQM